MTNYYNSLKRVVNLSRRRPTGDLSLAGRLNLSIIRIDGRTEMEGYNTSIEYKGATFMIQTQDKGSASNYIESLIYLSGRLIASKRLSYTAHLEKPNLKEIIQQMVEDLHAEVLDEIVEGKYDKFLE